MDIVKIIQETATWIEKVNNDYDVNLYRTEALTPTQHYYDIPANGKEGVLNHLVSTRSELLKNANVSLIPVEELHHYGRIMIFDIDDTVVDGAPEAESKGYIDLDDAPPYDTWLVTGKQLNEIGFYTDNNVIKDGVVIAWIPKDQYFYVNAGVEVSCIDNLWWASNENITEQFEVIKRLFDKPKEIIEPTKPINIESRAERLDEIRKRLDKNSPPIQYSSNKLKNFFRKLFGK